MWPITAFGGAAAVLGAWAGLLVHADLTRRRLPDLLTLPAAAGAVLGALVADPVILAAGFLWPVLYAVVGMLAGGVGGGDIKLAVSLGVLVAAAGGVGAVLAAVLAATTCGVVVGLASPRRRSPHGPAMIAAAGIVTLAAETL